MKALSISNLKKEYAGGFQALKGIDLEVQRGDFFALLGPNGAGKSTTIGIISSLVTKTSGQVKILDIDIDENHSLAKKKLGVVGQEVNFNQFEKVGDIIRNQAGYYGLSFKEARENAKHYMRKLDIWDKRNEQARKLSGGMKRRVMVAKALVNNPELLILDEPTAGVDIELRRSLWDFLTEINENGTTIILTTHYLEEAEELCDKIAILDKGKIVKSASKQDLLEDADSKTISVKVKEIPDLNHPILLELGASINDKNELTVNFNPKIINSREILSKIEEAGVMPFDFDVTGASLETVFLSITQKK